MKIVSSRGLQTTYEQLDEAGTVVSSSLIDIRVALQVLYADVVQLQASTTIGTGTGAGAIQVPGVIDDTVQTMLLERLWDLHTHADTALVEARTILNA